MSNTDEEEKDRFHGEGGEVVWHESVEAMYRYLANECDCDYFEEPGGHRIDLTKYKET